MNLCPNKNKLCYCNPQVGEWYTMLDKDHAIINRNERFQILQSEPRDGAYLASYKNVETWVGGFRRVRK